MKKNEWFIVVIQLIAIALDLFVIFVFPELSGNKFRIVLLFILISMLVVHIIKIKKNRDKEQ